MRKFFKTLVITLGLVSSSAFADMAVTPRWESVKDRDGDVAMLDREGTQLQVDMANVTGWETDNVRLVYRLKFKNTQKVDDLKVDEERNSITIYCPNVEVALEQKTWYYQNKVVHYFTYGKGKQLIVMFTKDPALFYVTNAACPK